MTSAESATEIVEPPLVSLVLINWNDAAYVGAAIGSIKSQDYPSIEAIVVDNASTDASRQVIAEHVGNDPRFRIVHLDENLGQLGAYFGVFKLLGGEFVTVVDADDVLFPSFVSAHVQVHLALPAKVAFTSSNVVGVTTEGRALTSGCAGFGRGAKPASRGLQPRDAAFRLSTVSNADYLELAKVTSTIGAGTPWIWGPGSSNMFRRSILALVKRDRENRTDFRAANNYLQPFCHILGNSALMDVPLSACRVHGSNDFASGQTIADLKTAARSVVQKAKNIAASKLPPALIKKIAAAKRKPAHKGKKPGPEYNPKDFGPVALLSRDPPIFLTGMAFQSMLGIAPAFGRSYGPRAAAFLIYPCWTIENPPSRAAEVVEAAMTHQAEYPAHELVFLCNTAAERELLARGGLNAHLLNKNFTVADAVFRPLADVPVEFDAVYNARFDPRKRHQLASAVEKVAYLAYSYRSTGGYDEQRDLAARINERNPNHVILNPSENGLPVRLPPEGVNAALNRAAVGLCLSSVEGSNYASVEYMLAGLPVVSTPSVGGREIYFDHEYCTICDPDPEAVRDAVEALKARKIPRDHIRARTLARIEPVRRRFLALIDDLCEQLGGKHHYADGVWPFAATSPLVTWKDYRKHLETFAAEDIRGGGLDADLGRWLAAAKGVQMQLPELRAIVQEIRSRPKCSLLVFGCGNDSLLYESANLNGTTAFIEDDVAWAEKIRPKLKEASIHLIDYRSRLSEWVTLLHRPDWLKLDLPEAVSAKRWDVIVIDGPAGHDNYAQYSGQEAPGRMKAIYMAAKLVAPGGCVFVHDCERVVELTYASHYLGNSRLFVRVQGHAILHGYAL